jgi:hypothetical protein
VSVFTGHTCGGDGFSRNIPLAERKAACRACRLSALKPGQCRLCLGTGLEFPGSPRSEKCEHCDGTGIKPVKNDCEECNDEAGWVTASTRAPMEHAAVLVSDGVGVLMGHFADGEWHYDNGNLTGVTHWQYLPDAPPVRRRTK